MSVKINMMPSPIVSIVIFMIPNFLYSLKKFFHSFSLNVIFLFRLKFIVELIVPPMMAERM